MRLVVIALVAILVTFALSVSAHAQKATVSVTPVKYETIVDVSEYPETVIKQEIEAALAATRTFTVLSGDADELDAMLNEIMSAGSSRITPRSQSAQFVIVPVVQALEVSRKSTPIPRLSGKVRVQSKGQIRMRVRVLETATGVLRTPIPVDIDWKGEAEVTDSYTVPGLQIDPSDFVDMAREAGRVFADQLLDQVYPVQVLARDGEQVWISRGSDAGYQIGETLRVLSGAGTSEVLTHPVTGEVLGVKEKNLGQIEVTSVEPKFTVAKIVSESGAIEEGAIVRR